MASNTGKKPRSLRENNVRLVLDLYYRHEQLSVLQISEELQLSRTTIFKINDILRDNDLILSDGKGTSTEFGGKKPNIFALNKDFGFVLCFHIQYDSIHVRLINLKLETVYSHDREIPVNAHLETVCETIRVLFKDVLAWKQDCKIISIAVAVHGLVNSIDGICYHSTHFPSWGQNAPLSELIARQIGYGIPIHIDSWIRFRTFAINEMGSLSDLSRGFILIDAGRFGVVAGIFFDKNIYKETNHLAGELGHMVVNPHDDHICQCGGRGCLESLLDFDRIIEHARSLQSLYPGSIVFAGKGNLSIEQIFEAFKQDDPLAVLLMDEVTDWLAIGLSNVNMIFFPELLVLEGDFGKAGSKYEKMLCDKMDRISMVRMQNKYNLVFHESDPEDTVVGAATYAIRNFFNELKFVY